VAASHTLPHSFAIPQISRLGVLTLYGYGIRVTMQSGHLQIEDGIGPERRKLRLPSPFSLSMSDMAIYSQPFV
jgi:hypothetical protein